METDSTMMDVEEEEEIMGGENQLMEDSISSIMTEGEEGKDISMQETDSFLQPSSKTRFTLRKRKRRLLPGGQQQVLPPPEKDDTDTGSICSLDLENEPDTKKKKGLARISSLTSMFSSVSTPLGKKVGKMGSALQKSLSHARLSPAGSMRTPSKASLARSASTVFGDPGEAGADGGPGGTGRTSPSSVSLTGEAGPVGWSSSPFRRSSVNLARKNSGSQLTPYKVPGPTPGKSRPTRYWSEVYSSVVHKLSPKELKLQEAVFEIYNGEEDLIEDLKLVRKTYADSLIHLNILKAGEEQLVFGPLAGLQPVHSMFRQGLARHQCKDGFWFEIGPAVAKWIKTLEGPYLSYCSNLIQAKMFLDKKQTEDKAFSDFLQRCLASPFSRKLDLWSFLDVPRSRLVKYPLLLKQVLKYSEDADDIKVISKTIQELESILVKVDKGMAESKCAVSISNMEFLSSVPPDCVRRAREEVLSGVLRNMRGTKVSVFLLDTGLVVGRTVTRPGIGKVVQVFREPIHMEYLQCEDLVDGEATKQGSFHRHFSNQNANKHAFKVWSSNDNDDVGNEKSHTLVAPDEHIKRQWVTIIQKTVESIVTKPSPSASETDSIVSSVASPKRTKFPKKLSSKAEILESIASRSSGRLRQSTPKLLSASRLFSPSKTPTGGRIGVYKRRSPLKGRSPVIKASLSQSALVKKAKKATARRNSDQENQLQSVVIDGKELKLGGRKAKSAAVLQALAAKKVRKPGEKRMLALINENTRPLSKSMAQLLDGSPSVVLVSSPRYNTRRAAKLSKSMSDLLQVN